MKKILLSVLAISSCIVIHAQDTSPVSNKAWSFGADANLYFLPDDFFILPVLKADKNKLHLEARYNYEDKETFSAWVGYNFSGGNEFSYTFTPMLGGVVGLSHGIAPGLELTLSYKKFELYSEMENLFDLSNSENNFYYNWADFTYSPKDWLWLGISAQRTRLYQTDLDIQRGLLIGGGFKNWELTGYLYNLGFDNPFILMALTANF
ncbi:MAG: hypothetical protein JNM57_07770 [Cyclobacteriaceae bacterium]|nr:hypothetical protein [Cyclobacteriaceae bacterium]